MNALNPFNFDIKEIECLTPRRKRYIKERNAAQDQRIFNVKDAALQYASIVNEVRRRYQTSEAKDQYLIKPYLTILYFELGQLFETQEKPQEALRYYEQAGLYGHLVSLEKAKRLGSKIPFTLEEKTCSSKLDGQNEFRINKPAIFETLHKSIVLIDSKKQKGSAFIVNDDRLGRVIITVEHVVKCAEVARVF